MPMLNVSSVAVNTPVIPSSIIAALYVLYTNCLVQAEMKWLAGIVVLSASHLGTP